jgi:hypothetical protein
MSLGKMRNRRALLRSVHVRSAKVMQWAREAELKGFATGFRDPRSLCLHPRLNTRFINLYSKALPCSGEDRNSAARSGDWAGSRVRWMTHVAPGADWLAIAKSVAGPGLKIETWGTPSVQLHKIMVPKGIRS